MEPLFWIITAAGVLVAVVVAFAAGRLLLFRSHEPKHLRAQLVVEHQALRSSYAALNAQHQQIAENHAEQKHTLAAYQQNIAALQVLLATEVQRVEDLRLQASSLLTDKDLYYQKWQQASVEGYNAQNNFLRARTQLEEEQKRLVLQAESWNTMQRQMETNFDALASKALEAKTQSFSQTQASEFTHLVAPLKQELSELKIRLETAAQQASGERNALFGQVQQMLLQAQNLGQQAHNLTTALKGQAKQQGDWGEWILENILEYSGLTKNKEYFLQQTGKNDDGKTIRPDVVIKYPDNRVMIVDSKVTLVGYDRVVSETNPQDQSQLLIQLVRHFKTHIDELSKRNYHQAKDALDFVVMFVPLEGAYIAVMQADADLWKYAYDKRILLLSPTNLVAALKLVHNMWQRDEVNKNAEAIAERAAKMYDKLVSFVESFEGVGKALEKAQGVYNEARSKMIAGNDNLLLQGQKMEKLQKRQSIKPLPASLVDPQ